MDKVWIIVTIISSIFLSALGQVLLKYGMNSFGPVDFSDLKKVFLMFFEPYVVMGLILYVLSTVFWLVALSNADLSYVYPLVTLSVVITVVISKFVFGEAFNLAKIGGIALVTIGAILIGIGRIKT